MYPTHAVSTTTTIKSSLHKIHSCAYCTYANQAYYSQLRMLLSDNQKTIRRWASTKCTPVYITHQMNAQRARLRPAYYSLATAGGANKIRSSTWVLSDTNKLATVQPHSAVHEQTASLQPHPKGLPIRCGVHAPQILASGVWYGVAHLYNRNTLWSPVRYSFRMSHSQPRLNRPTGARIPSCPMVVVVTRLNQIGLQP